MKERPILFSAPMVRALLAGTKTQTRRVVKPWEPRLMNLRRPVPDDVSYLPDFTCYRSTCPYGQPGDRLWVRETFAEGIHQMADVNHWAYAADRFAEQQRLGERWKPSIHMPRSASRITLEITGIRVERVQDITNDDIKAEGLDDDPRIVSGEIEGSMLTPFGRRVAFEDLWGSINGPGSWDANPWVWVVEFKRLNST